MPGPDTEIGNTPVGKRDRQEEPHRALRGGEMYYNDCFRERDLALNSPWPNTQDPAVSVAKNTSI